MMVMQDLLNTSQDPTTKEDISQSNSSHMELHQDSILAMDSRSQVSMAIIHRSNNQATSSHLCKDNQVMASNLIMATTRCQVANNHTRANHHTVKHLIWVQIE